MEAIMSAEQKVAIITGASRGIGEALVKGYRDRNFRVVANSRSIRPSSDPDILAVPGSIGEPRTAEHIVSQAIKGFGRVDTLSTMQASSSQARSPNIRAKATPGSWRSISTASFM
jgi:NAD(P)-dependent dehydrogenase (short-subunit alcohol dehydrogenase family)